MVKPQLKLKKRLLSTLQLQQHNFVAGQRGEEAGVVFLRELGYQILDQNIVFGRCEIDIAAVDLSTDTLVICEVKTRSSKQFGHPTQAVNYKKIWHLITAGEQYIRKIRWQKDYRFDTISVTIDKDSREEIEHFKNITWGMSKR